jgi:hypothetical protein
MIGPGLHRRTVAAMGSRARSGAWALNKRIGTADGVTAKGYQIAEKQGRSSGGKARETRVPRIAALMSILYLHKMVQPPATRHPPRLYRTTRLVSINSESSPPVRIS